MLVRTLEDGGLGRRLGHVLVPVHPERQLTRCSTHSIAHEVLCETACAFSFSHQVGALGAHAFPSMSTLFHV